MPKTPKKFDKRDPKWPWNAQYLDPTSKGQVGPFLDHLAIIESDLRKEDEVDSRWLCNRYDIGFLEAIIWMDWLSAVGFVGKSIKGSKSRKVLLEKSPK